MLDASALTKRYAFETGRDQVLALLEAAMELFVAAHCQVELASVLVRRRREGSLPHAEFDRVWQAVQRDLADMVPVPLDGHVERFAFAALQHGCLHAMQALHVGSALAAGVDLFVTADRRQAHAARALGLQTDFLNVGL